MSLPFDFTKCIKLSFNSISLTLLIGCQTTYVPMSNALTKYTEEHATPYVLANEDAFMACSLGESFTSYFLSVERVTESPNRMGILLKTLAATCAEQRAWEEDLRFARAVYAKEPAEAQDAEIALKRLLALAAKRQYEGYVHFVHAFGEPDLGCPRFKNNQDEFFYLMGLVNGVQSIINSKLSDDISSIPTSVGNKVVAGSKCLNAEKWWGTPWAIEAAVWTSSPDSNPDNKNPLKKLKAASEFGLKQGVRLSQVFEAEIYRSTGDDKAAKQVIQSHAEALQIQPADPRLKLMDHIATLQLQALSDRIWTEATGHRTPHGKFGIFPKEVN